MTTAGAIAAAAVCVLHDALASALAWLGLDDDDARAAADRVLPGC
jgi:hypothetical protein